MILLAAWGRRWREQPRERTLRQSLAAFILLWQVFVTIWWLLPRNYELGTSLPLHLCDLAAWIAPFALIFQRRWLRTLLYFWAFAFSTAAFITPIIEFGPGHIHFWLFWGGHTLIVGAALYDVVAGGYRPRFRDFVIASVFSVGYAALIIPFNIALKTNYGYLGATAPDAATVIDILGDWPLRIVWVALIGEALMLLLWAPWAIAGARNKPDLR